MNTYAPEGKGICPNCEKVRNLRYTEELVSTPIEGIWVEVLDKYYYCADCDTQFEDPNDPYDILELAQTKYQELYCQKEALQHGK